MQGGIDTAEACILYRNKSIIVLANIAKLLSDIMMQQTTWKLLNIILKIQ